MSHYRILFNPRRRYFLEPIVPVVPELEKLGHTVAISAMEDEQDELLKDYLLSRKLERCFLTSHASLHERWDLVVLGGRLYDRAFTYPQKFAFLNHGGSNGGNGEIPYTLESFIHENMDAYVALSRNEFEFGEAYHAGMWERKVVKAAGWPKLDKAFSEGASIRKKLHDSLQLDPRKPIVVFTSHWQDFALLRTIGLNVLNVLANNPYLQRNVQVIVTAHPLLFSDCREVYGGDPEGLLSRFCEKSHMHFHPTLDSLGLMLLGDVFITDNSSLFCEIAALGKQIISYIHPLYTFSDPKLRSLLREASFSLHYPSQLPELVKKALSPSADKEKAIQNLACYSYDYLGNAAPEVARALIEIIEHL